MRLGAILAFATSALAATLPQTDVPTSLSLDVGVSGVANGTVVDGFAALTLPRPEDLFECRCPHDRAGDIGVHINQAWNWYQCAYPNGACQWNIVSLIWLGYLKRMGASKLSLRSWDS